MSISKSQQFSRLFELFQERMAENFYGQIVVKLQHGNVVHTEVTQSIKFEEPEEEEEVIKDDQDSNG